MNHEISLKTKIVITIVTMLIVSVLGGCTMIWYSFRVDGMVTRIVNNHIESYQSATSLETALVNQKGLISYYFIDNNPEWLQRLGQWRQIFRERLKEVGARALPGDRKDILARIEKEYNDYILMMDKVLEHYKQDEDEKGVKLHLKGRDNFFSILSLCSNYKKNQAERIHNTRILCHSNTRMLRKITGLVLFLQLAVGILLSFFLINQVLKPLRELRHKTDRLIHGAHPADELKALSNNVSGLIKHIGETDNELKKSRGSLLVSEKMAMVGKLAAGMAHSVRNPLTSVKMRLFTLNRTLDLSEDQSEDFKVISEEIEHIDTIVGNFLEFSRPPKLQMQTTSPSSVVDMMMQLLKHRLRAYDVTATIGREKMLPEIHGDPEQLKEVLVNLVENACQATGKGGQIRIKEENWVDEMYKKWCIIHIEDNGPGIPEDVAEHVFNPFYTTKGDGTGLGLSIAERIISNHGGKIKLRSIPGEGTVFSVFLPVEEDKTGANDADSSDY